MQFNSSSTVFVLSTVLFVLFATLETNCRRTQPHEKPFIYQMNNLSTLRSMSNTALCMCVCGRFSLSVWIFDQKKNKKNTHRTNNIQLLWIQMRIKLRIKTSAYISTSNNSLCFLLVVCCTHFYRSWRQLLSTKRSLIWNEFFYVISRFVFPFHVLIPNN